MAKLDYGTDEGIVLCMCINVQERWQPSRCYTLYVSTVIMLLLLLLLLQGKDDQPVEKAVSGKYILGGVEGGTSVMDKDVASITARIDCMRYCQRSSTCAM